MDHADIIIRALKSRVSIHVVQGLLKRLHLPTARSWTELEAIIRQSIEADQELADTFIAAIAEQSIHDFKAVTYFRVRDEDMPVVINALLEATIDDGPLAEAFPIAVSDSVLETDNGNLKIISKYQDDFGFGVILSRRREFTLTEEYSREQFSEALLAEFPHHEKIVAIKSYCRQTFDVIYLSVEARTLELRADITRSDTLFQTVKQLGKSNDDLKAFANVFLYRAANRQVIESPCNLFPLIRGLYDDPSGAIKRLGFATSTGSIKNETMKGGVDLREELFHKFGAIAINHQMSLFEIAIIWHREDIDQVNSKPELHIPGTYKNSTSLAPRCDFAILKGIGSASDSKFILNKLIALAR